MKVQNNDEREVRQQRIGSRARKKRKLKEFCVEERQKFAPFIRLSLSHASAPSERERERERERKRDIWDRYMK